MNNYFDLKNKINTAATWYKKHSIKEGFILKNISNNNN